MERQISWLAICAVTVLTCVCLSNNARAEEPLERFVEGLKSKQYFDVAFDYLERSENSGAITKSLKSRLDYEKAQVLLDGISQVRDRTKRQQNLDRSQALLSKFIQEKEFHEYASIARKTLGDLLIVRAQIAISQSKDEKLKPDEAKALVEKARGYYKQADEILKKTKDALGELWKRMDPDAKDSERVNLRKKYESDFMVTRLNIGFIPEQVAETYQPGSPKYVKNLEAAIAAYDDYANDYGSRLIGLRAKFYSAKCMHKLDKAVEAQTYIREILDQDNSPAFRELKREACLLGMKVWFNEEPPKYLAAIKSMQPLLDQLTPSLGREPKWLELKLAAAKAYHGYQMQLKAKTEGKTADDRKLETQARNKTAEFIREVSRIPSESKEEAQKLLVEWGVRGKVDDPNQDKTPKSFVEARDRATEILGDYENDKLTAATLRQRLSSAADAEKEQLTAQLTQAEESVKTAPRKAIEMMRLAIRLADEDTPSSEFETLYYKLAFSYYTIEHFHESLVTCEHLILLAPNSAPARSAAQVGVQALLQMAAKADASSKFEVNRLRQLCDQILRTWPSHSVSVKAAAAMIQLALRAGDVDAAEQYLQRVPDGTPGKDTLQLNVGFSLWATIRKGEYELALGSSKGEIKSDEAEELKKKFQDLRVRAQSYLASGVTTLEADAVDSNSARGVLALAQLYADFDKMDEAVAVLENPQYGPLTLIDQKHPATISSKSYKSDAYQTALRGYVGSLGSAADSAAMTDKARNMMQKLKGELATVKNGKQRLIGIYLRMARDVKVAMSALETETERAAYQKGLVAFLDAVQAEADDSSVLIWVAGTYSSFAEAAEEKGDAEPASQFYGKASGVYEKLLSIDIENPDTLTDAQAREMNRRLARAQSKSGNHAKAIEIYTEILTETSAIIDIQFEAAETLQAWGKVSGDPNKYAYAMAGTGEYVSPKTERKTKAIWGWGKLASTVIRYDKYKKRFVPARYNLALSRFEYAKLRKQPKKYLEMSEKDILMTMRSDPKLYNEEWHKKFGTLMRQIQKELGKTATGLPK